MIEVAQVFGATRSYALLRCVNRPAPGRSIRDLRILPDKENPKASSQIGVADQTPKLRHVSYREMQFIFEKVGIALKKGVFGTKREKETAVLGCWTAR